jgi:hypothetical protein
VIPKVFIPFKITTVMNRLLKFADFVNEAVSLASLNRVYAMTPEWWSAWKLENIEKYNFEQDAFSKTYNVYDVNKKLVFVFDYSRSKIFTNETPSTFILHDELTQDEMNKVKDKAEQIQNPEALDAQKDLKKELEKNPPKKKEGKEVEEAEMVGTGTLNPVSAADSNPKVKGYRNTTDSASGGSYPTYIG